MSEHLLGEALAYYRYYQARKTLERALARLGRAHANHDSRACIELIDRSVATAMLAVEQAEERIEGLEGER